MHDDMFMSRRQWETKGKGKGNIDLALFGTQTFGLLDSRTPQPTPAPPLRRTLPPTRWHNLPKGKEGGVGGARQGEGGREGVRGHR